MYKILDNLKGKDFKEVKSKDFEDFMCDQLKHEGKIQRQVFVENRGDGYRGKVDLILTTPKEKIGIEIDYMTARQKSIFKLKQLDVDRRVVILRSPFSYQEICT